MLRHKRQPHWSSTTPLPSPQPCRACAVLAVRPGSDGQLALVEFHGGSEPAQREEPDPTLPRGPAAEPGSQQGHAHKATEAQLTKAGDSLSLYGQVLGLLRGGQPGPGCSQELRAAESIGDAGGHLQLGCCGVSRSLWWSYAWADLWGSRSEGFLEYRISNVKIRLISAGHPTNIHHLLVDRRMVSSCRQRPQPRRWGVAGDSRCCGEKMKRLEAQLKRACGWAMPARVRP